MKFLRVLFIQISIIIISLNSYAQKVSNLHFKQVEEDIHIYYDLETEESCTVFLLCKEGNTSNWGLPLEHITGNKGIGQTSGKDKLIIWNVLEESSGISGNIQFKIDAINESGMRLYTDMISHPAYFISCYVVEDEVIAKEKVYLLKTQGLRAHYYWMPDIIKKGKSFYEVVIGPFESKTECKQSHITVKSKFRSNAYILRIE